MDQAVGRGYRGVSFWLDSLVESGSDDLTPRPALPGDREFDIAIVGGGLTGLWSAYYLLKRSPGLRIAILEKEIAGFGASGRNGGWCSALFPASTAALERRHGLDAALAMRRAMIDTVAEVGRVTAAEGIDCDFVQGGTLLFARSAPQLGRAKGEVAEAEHYGVDQILRIDDGRASPTNTLATLLEPACARLHPGKLVRGLARVVEALGARSSSRPRCCPGSRTGSRRRTERSRPTRSSSPQRVSGRASGRPTAASFPCTRS